MNAPELNALATVAVVHLVATAMPGPNILLVLRTAISRSRRDAGTLIIGIAVGDAIWAVAAMFGVSVVFAELTWLYHLVRVIGACYLVFLGVQAWRSAGDDLGIVDATPGNAFRVGLLANATNPKTVIFFGSVFASTLPPRASMGVRATVIAVIVANALWFHLVFALLCSHSRIQHAIRQAKFWIDRITGALLATLGVTALLSGILDLVR
jgi:RhtB (resistance to homoserine/threonine) family protein